MARYPEGGAAPTGPAMSVSFVIDGCEVQALNAAGGPSFSEAVSFFIQVDTQDEIDSYWDKPTHDGGQPGQCGWLKGRFGLSWQVVPKALGQLLGDPDPARAGRARNR